MDLTRLAHCLNTAAAAYYNHL